jgi:hypothetical protein
MLAIYRTADMSARHCRRGARRRSGGPALERPARPPPVFFVCPAADNASGNNASAIFAWACRQIELNTQKSIDKFQPVCQCIKITIK